MRAAFFTLGCKVNQYETELMREDLIKNGYEIVTAQDQPDVFIINSCTVTAESDRKTRQMVRKYRRMLPDAVIVLTGCMPQAFTNEAAALTEADIVLGNATNNLLTSSISKFLIDNKQIVDVQPHDKTLVQSTITDFYERTKAFLKIEDGCDRFCSYCIIPYARGRVRSKSIDNIVTEVTALADAGYKEVVLIGINLSAYGKENGLCLADAVEAAAGVDGIERVRLGSMEPDQFTDDVIERLAKIEKLCPQFHLSLQSGCDKTLKAMNRHYDTEFYRQLINKLRESFDNCSITTDIMVGFAGETDEDFDISLNFLKEIGFAKAHVFAYSRRKGTKAYDFAQQVSNQQKHHRSSKMIAAANETQAKFLQSQIGLISPVLFENRTKDGFYEGYTPNYTLVKVNSDTNPCGKIMNVKLLSVDNESCIGEIVG
ncbi:MAG: tRNA (N(6)-L-threonylcarbamoyladenosine(37)-C(2))-methylthiotransferase MtaB [Clostridia bacterium]|nr:tRNA (N(6)-L-threonylcarbamoyladenosine(37)-C(2))-methylthiotransferase MtaB [Clostridia bacterium]